MNRFTKKVLCMAISCIFAVAVICPANAVTIENGTAAMSIDLNDAFET